MHNAKFNLDVQFVMVHLPGPELVVSPTEAESQVRAGPASIEGNY